MNTEKILNRCPKCQGPIPADAPQGLCAKCLLAAAATPTEAGLPSAKHWDTPRLEAVRAAFPQLEILELIGHGGMGVVYRARQPKLDRVVALKILPQTLAADPAFAERFNREARVLARLNHPNIVAVHDFGWSGGLFYVLMEFVDGVNLRQAMQAGRFSPQQALGLVPKICEALQFAHDEGILHRDIKPENILLDTRGRVKIVDFGIAKLVGDKAHEARITASGMVIGTPHYMAPEQLEHPQDVDQRADIYSLGVVFYEMLTGELPIGRFAPPSQKTPVDPRVDDVVLRALEKERERRQRNAAEVKTELERITATPAMAAGMGEAGQREPTQAAAPKTSKCYISTPEHLRTLRGQLLYIYQAAGVLLLDAEKLSFRSGWQVVAIPLVSIRAIGVGDYPASAKPGALNFLSVTFEEQGISRTLLFTPTRSRLSPVWETNRVVQEWTSALQQATQTATGRALPIDHSRLVQNWAWWELWKAYFLTAAAVTLVFNLVPLILQQRLPRWPVDWIQGPIVATAVLGGLLLSRWKRRRRAESAGNLDALVSHKAPLGSVQQPASPIERSDPAEVDPADYLPAGPKPLKRKRPFWWTVSAWIFVLIGLLAMIDTLACLYERPIRPTLYPGLAHLLAGIALLTLSRRWRVAALVALSLAVLAGAFVGIVMAVSPEHGLVQLPALHLSIPVTEKPWWAATSAVGLALVLFWPCYLLLNAKARSLFGLLTPK